MAVFARNYLNLSLYFNSLNLSVRRKLITRVYVLHSQHACVPHTGRLISGSSQTCRRKRERRSRLPVCVCVCACIGALGIFTTRVIRVCVSHAEHALHVSSPRVTYLLTSARARVVKNLSVINPDRCFDKFPGD